MCGQTGAPIASSTRADSACLIFMRHVCVESVTQPSAFIACNLNPCFESP